MADAFNPYHQWLEIPQKSVRPNLYELLSLAPGESDSEKIALAADRAIAKVRSVRPGDKAKAWAGLLDELNNAKRLLMDPTRRAEYDEAMKRSSALKPATTAKPKPRPGSPATPAAQASVAAKPKADDPRYPPGTVTKTKQPAVTTPPADAMLPPTTAYVQPPGMNPATPLPSAVLPEAATAVAMPTAWPGAAPTATAMPPQPSAYPAYAQPAGYGGQSYPQQPAYAAQPTYPQGAYPPAGYAQPAMYPQAPGYPQYGYQQPQGPMGPPPGAYDPMAPVAMPVGNVAMAGQMGAPMAMPVSNYASPVAAPGFPSAAAVAGAPMAGIPMGVASPATVAAVPMGQAVATAAPASGPTIGVRTVSAASLMAANRRRQKSMIMLLVGGGVSIAVLCVAAALAYPYVMGKPDEEQIAENPATTPETPTANPTPFPVGTAPPGTVAPSPAPMTAPPMTDSTKTMTPPVAPAPMPSDMANTPPASPPTTPAPMPPVPETTPPATPAPTAPAPETTPPAVPPTPAPTPTPPESPTPTPSTTTPTPETPPTPPAPAEDQLTRKDLLALSKALTTARAAVAEHNFDEANKQLKEAEKFAKTPELQAKVDRLWQVNDMTRQFREAVVAAIQDLDAGEVFQVGGSTQVAVVETFPDKIIVRIAGMNRTYPVQDLPAGLAVALADMKLDTSDPSNRVIKGAYLLSGKNVNSDVIDKAKTWWEEAQLGGVDVSKLMPFIKDEYEFKKELAELSKQQADEPQ